MSRPSSSAPLNSRPTASSTSNPQRIGSRPATILDRCDGTAHPFFQPRISREDRFGGRGAKKPNYDLASLEAVMQAESSRGMPLEVFISTEDRTAISYLAKPLLDQFERALREQ